MRQQVQKKNLIQQQFLPERTETVSGLLHTAVNVNRRSNEFCLARASLGETMAAGRRKQGHDVELV